MGPHRSDGRSTAKLWVGNVLTLVHRRWKSGSGAKYRFSTIMLDAMALASLLALAQFYRGGTILDFAIPVIFILNLKNYEHDR